MKKIVMTLFGALLLAGCQNELYTESQKENGSGQGAYIAAEGPIQIFVEEGKEYFIKDVKVGLTVKEDKAFDVPLIVGDQADCYELQTQSSYAVHTGFIEKSEIFIERRLCIAYPFV